MQSDPDRHINELITRAAGERALSPQDLHIILDSVPTPLSWAYLPGGEIQFINRAFRHTFGYPDGAFPSVDDWIQRAYPLAQDRETAREHWTKLWQAHATGISTIDPMTLHVRCADGTILIVQHRGVLLHRFGIAIATFEDITERKRAEDNLRRLSLEDTLTGLANRRAMHLHWLEDISAGRQHTAALLLLDLDGFKAVNDKFGHAAGDQVLVAVANLLRTCIRATDLLCRLGGDEFVILLPALDNAAQVEQICQRVANAMQEPIHIGTQAFELSISIGASLFPQDAADFDTLLRHADEALYRAKKAGKGQWAWYAAPADD